MHKKRHFKTIMVDFPSSISRNILLELKMLLHLERLEAFRNKTMNLRTLALSLLFGAVLGGSAQASCLPVLLTIDISDPCAVKITATGLDSGAWSKNTNENSGIDLENFFSYPISVGGDSSICGDLTPNGCNTIPYDSWVVDNASGCNVDLNLYSSDECASYLVQKFSSCFSAFSGTAILDLSEFACELPSVGTYGEILSGYSRREGAVIGLWEVICTPVPEPSQYGFGLVLALAGLFVWRRVSLTARA